MKCNYCKSTLAKTIKQNYQMKYHQDWCLIGAMKSIRKYDPEHGITFTKKFIKSKKQPGKVYPRCGHCHTEIVDSTYSTLLTQYEKKKDYGKYKIVARCGQCNEPYFIYEFSARSFI